MSDILPFNRVLNEQATDTTKRKGERTRLRLMAGCARSLEFQTFAALRVADICAATEVSQGTFYIYFNDKADITGQTLDAFASHIQASLGSAGRIGGLKNAVRHATLRYAQMFRANRGLMRCLLLGDEDGTQFKAIYQGLNARWNQRTAAAIARHRGTETTPRDLMTAYALGGMVDDLLASLYIRGDPGLLALTGNGDDLDAVVDCLTDIWLAAVR